MLALEASRGYGQRAARVANIAARVAKRCYARGERDVAQIEHVGLGKACHQAAAEVQGVVELQRPAARLNTDSPGSMESRHG
jgi:hypothetical protein